MRGVSTVLDVTVFLLLVSVAAVTLTVPAANPPGSTADETAEAIATTTGNVTYAPVGPDGTAVEPARRVAGTHAELFARGALANLRLDGDALAPSAGGFRGALRTEAETVLAWSNQRTSVVATWEPYEGAPLKGRFAVGQQPPPTVDVATATLTVPVPVESVDARAAAARGGYRGVARASVRPTLRTTLGPSNRTLASPGSAARRDWRRRVQAYATSLGLNQPGDGWPAARNAIERRLLDRVTADLRSRYDSAAAAARNVTTGQVTVVIREWSA